MQSHAVYCNVTNFIYVFACLMTVMRQICLNAFYEYLCLTLKITEYIFFPISTSTKLLDFFNGPVQSSIKSMSL